MKIQKFSFQKIQLFIKKFEKCQQPIEGILYLKEIALILRNVADERANNFLSIVQKEFDILSNDNWKKMEIHFPEINSRESINKYLFMQENLKAALLPSGENAWERLQKNIISTFDRYEVMFGQMVRVEII
jgi:hypothetical protein